MKLRNQRGGALVESFFICGVLSLFLVGIPMLGKSIDLKQTTIQASRYAAWEKTVYVNADQADQVDTRFFQDASAPISSAAPANLGANYLWGAQQNNDSTQPAAANANQDAAMSTVPSGGKGNASAAEKTRIEIVNGSVENTVGMTKEGGEIFGSLGALVRSTGEVLGPSGWGKGDPYIKGIVKADVNVAVKDNALIFEQGGQFSASTAIMIDGWSAANPEVIRERVHGFVPTNRLERVGDFISKVKIIPMLDDLEYLEKAFGCVKTAVVPGKEINDPLPSFDLVGGDRC